MTHSKTKEGYDAWLDEVLFGVQYDEGDKQSVQLARSAPELLEALKAITEEKMKDWKGVTPHPESTTGKALKAIAKATGGWA